MSKCEQCIVREFSALKTLNKDELLKLADCKTSYVVKKGEVIFELSGNEADAEMSHLLVRSGSKVHASIKGGVAELNNNRLVILAE